MLRRFISGLVIVTVSVSTAFAEWRVTSEKDRLTGATVKTAWLRATNNEQTQLAIRCLIDPLVGGLYVEILTPIQFTRGRLAFRYRLDDQPVETRYIPPRSDGWGVQVLNRADEALGAKRMRIELLPGNKAGLFYEFDLTGIDKVMREMQCQETRTY